MKNFNGKAIYNPSGKAGEYSYWACNFYVGCSNSCTYCYCKKGVLAGTMGGDKPTLKKCFKDENHALEVFKKEMEVNLPELQKHGLFFSFTTDPMLVETIGLTIEAMLICNWDDIPVKVLTKRADWVDAFLKYGFGNQSIIAFGFTLTGHDELEPGASTNAERIEAMKRLHEAGFKTFASIEPIIDFTASKDMIVRTLGFCDLYKIGLESGKKYPKDTMKWFVLSCMVSAQNHHAKIYFKDSITKAIGVSSEDMKNWMCGSCITGRDYNLFNQ